MIEIPYLFAAAVVVAAGLGSIAIWAPRRLLVRAGALGMFGLFLPIGFAGWVDLLSRPKPVAFEWWLSHAEEATVLAGTFREGAGIYVWLQLEEAEEPRAYRLPWSRERAQALQEALEQAAKNGTAARMRLPFEPTLDPRRPQFYALPQPALPPKDGPTAPAQRYKQAEQEA